MKRRNGQVYLLQFKNGNPDEFYKELKSIYDHHSADEIGCKVEWLWQNKISPEKPFENSKVKISLIEIKK